MLIGGALVAGACIGAVSVATGRATLPQAGLGAGLGIGSVVFAGLAGLVMLSTAIRSGGKNFAMFVATAGGVRMFISLAIAVIAFMTSRPEALSFWGSFLAASIVWLGIETTWAMKMTRVMFPAGTTGKDRPPPGDGAAT